MRLRVASLMPPRPCNARSTVPMDTFAISAIRWIPCFSLLIDRTPRLHAQRVLLPWSRAATQDQLDYSPNGRLVSAAPGTHAMPPPLESEYRSHGPRTLTRFNEAEEKNNRLLWCAP